MSEWLKQKRPEWCPHQDCQFKLMKQNLVCVGILPETELHNGIPNYARICFYDEVLPLEMHTRPVYDMQINEGDVFHLRSLLDALYPIKEPPNDQ